MEQTFIAIIRNKDGKQIDFQRYNFKRLATVRNHLRTLAANSLYKACVPGIDHADIYETPYEWHGLDPVYTIKL
jgi:hypothetical protein